MKRTKSRILFTSVGKRYEVAADYWMVFAERICKMQDAHRRMPYMWAWGRKVYKTCIDAINAACEGKLTEKDITVAIRSDKSFLVNKNIVRRMTVTEFDYGN